MQFLGSLVCVAECEKVKWGLLHIWCMCELEDNNQTLGYCVKFVINVIFCVSSYTFEVCSVIVNVDNCL
jgi:hypothetical protein